MVVKAVATARRVFNYISLVPRLLPDFISQLWRKSGEGLVEGHVVIITKLSPHYVLSPPFPVHDVVLIPGLLPIFLHSCEIKSGSGLHGDEANETC